jgi:hypothetical protein
VEYFEWLAGTPEQMEIVHISRMCGGNGGGERWQFYEDNEDMGFWYRYRYYPEKREDKVEEVQ